MVPLTPVQSPTSDLGGSSFPAQTTPPSSSSSSRKGPAPKVSLVDTSKGYSSVNKLSLLPDEVRTAANLEGETVPQEREAELMQQYAKERADYEEKQLRKMAEMRAKRQAGAAGESPCQEPEAIATPLLSSDTTTSAPSSPPRVGGYDVIVPMSGQKGVAAGRAPSRGVDNYEDPADAVAGATKVGAVGVAKKASPPTQKMLSVGAGSGREEYTPVFNPLPQGQVETIHTHQGHGRSARIPSDSSPTLKSPHAATSKAPPLPPAYENSPSPSKYAAVDASKGEGAEEEGVVTGERGESSPEEMKRGDSCRQSKRTREFEVVEFDPDKPRKFRVTSIAKKPSIKRGNEVDGTGDSLEGAVSVTSPPAYAMVSMVDKKKNRLECDADKMEGSGVPQRYRVPITTTS